MPQLLNNRHELAEPGFVLGVQTQKRVELGVQGADTAVYTNAASEAGREQIAEVAESIRVERRVAAHPQGVGRVGVVRIVQRARRAVHRRRARLVDAISNRVVDAG